MKRPLPVPAHPLLVATIIAASGLVSQVHAAVTNVAWYRLGENDPGAASGLAVTNTTADIVGTKHLKQFNSPLYTSAVVTTATSAVGSALAVQFNGSSQFLSNAVVTLATNNFGLEAWIKPASSNALYQFIAYNGTSSTDGWGLFWQNGRINVWFGNVIQFSSGTMATGAWAHVALVRDTGTTTLYVNGVAANTSPFGPKAPTGRLTVGGNPNMPVGDYFNGGMDEVRVFTFGAGQFVTNDLLLNFQRVTTLAATPVEVTSAKLNGRAHPVGLPTSAWFEWGTTTNYGNTTSAQELGSGTGNTNFSQIVSGLFGVTNYHFRAVASNSFGVALGANQSFTTLGVLRVLINEFAYYDKYAAGLEFVELYNAGTNSVDLSGWVLGGFDPLGLNDSITLPESASIAPGAFYVIGNPSIPNVNLHYLGEFLENDNEALTLKTSNGALVDEVSYGLNKGLPNFGTNLITKGGLWGNNTSPQGGGATMTSYARFLDGRNTDVNGRDFGMRIFSPGASNSAGGIVQFYAGPDVDSLAVGAEVPGFHGSFVAPRVIDPTSTNFFYGGVVPLNPNAIPQSPQGGKAMIVWDPYGGGNTAGSEFTLGTNSSFSLLVYIDPTLAPTATEQEEWGIGIGSEDPTTHSRFSDNQNGSSGVGWAFVRTATNATLRLIDFGPGGPTNSWVTLASLNLTGQNPGWHVLGLDLAGSNIIGRFDATIVSGTNSVTNLIGNFWVGYREGFTYENHTRLRPPTLDRLPNPVVPNAAVLSGPRMLTNGQFTALVSGATNRTYIIEVSSNLTVWSYLTAILHASAPTPFFDTATNIATPTRYYRARLGP